MAFSFDFGSQSTNQPANNTQPASGLGGFSFGNQNQAQQNQQQTGQNQTQAKPTFSFGATPSNNNAGQGLFGQSQSQQPQTQSRGLFGQTQQGQTGQTGGLSGQTGQTGGIFGQTQGQTGQTGQTGGLFGQTQGQTGQTSSLFGQTQTQSGGLFGQTQNNAQTNPFGQNQAQNQTQNQQQNQNQNNIQKPPQSLTQSIYGQTMNQPQFSWSRPSQPLSQSTMPTFPPANLLSQSTQPVQTTSNYGPTQPASIQDQLLRIKNAWDPTHPDCMFQAYFYNRVAPETASLYTKPENHKQAAWDDAVAKRPDNSVVPVMAIGFTDLQTRMNGQQQQIHAYRTRMHEIVDKLKELDDRQLLHTTPKISVAMRRHTELSQRALQLATKVQVLRCRGYAMRPEEEQLRTRLTELQKRLKNPDTFGRTEEVWAKMTLIRARQKAAERDDTRSVSMINFEDGDGLDQIEQVLEDHVKGLAYVAKVVKDDLAMVEGEIEKYRS